MPIFIDRGERWATVCSLIETCKLNRVEPYGYLTDVLTRMVDGHPVNRLDELLSWAWKPEILVKPSLTCRPRTHTDCSAPFASPQFASPQYVRNSPTSCERRRFKQRRRQLNNLRTRGPSENVLWSSDAYFARRPLAIRAHVDCSPKHRPTLCRAVVTLPKTIRSLNIADDHMNGFVVAAKAWRKCGDTESASDPCAVF